MQHDIVSKKYDVIIIGAGVAGSVLARLLAEAGVAAVLVEKDEFSGKTNACGGLFDRPYFDRYVSDSAVMEQQITKNTFVMPWGEVCFDCDQVTVKRRVFDRHLAESAALKGAELLNNTKALSWSMAQSGCVQFTLQNLKTKQEYMVEAKIAAFCDGPNSLAIQNPRFDSKKNKKFWAYAYAYEVKGIPFEANIMKVYLDQRLFPWGYGWIFPNRQDSNIGVGTIISEIDKGIKLKEKLFEFIDEYKTTAPLLHGCEIVDKKGGFIPMWLVKNFSDDSQVVLGDAAGMVSPLFGAGIDYAIEAAQVCAPALIEALKNKDYSRRCLQKYDNALNAGFLKDLRKQMLVARIIIFSRKFGKSWPIKALAVIAFGGKYTRWNKIRILFYPLLGKPGDKDTNHEMLAHK
jgi:geranylgeranyl reductase family protein